MSNLSKWSIDAIVLRDRLVFVYGWILGKGGVRPHRISLTLVSAACEGDSSTIDAKLYGSRPDVAAIYNEASAHQSGFLIYGRLTHPVALRSDAKISIYWEDGVIESLVIPVPQTQPIGLLGRLAQMKTARIWKTLMRAAGIVKTEGWGALSKKISRHLKLEKERKSKIVTDSATAKLNQQKAILVIDHDLGGGANFFRERYIQSLIQSGHVVLRYTYSVARLQHFLAITHDGAEETFVAIDGWSQLLQILQAAKLVRVIYNTAASLPDAASLPYNVVDFCGKSNVKITVFLHDYFAICPSHFLLNNEGRYCGIPDVSTCHNCLRRSNQGFVALYPEINITPWRCAWGLMLAAADEVVTFSGASAQIFLKVYPFLKDRLLVKPHQIDYLPVTPSRVSSAGSSSESAWLIIGIVGAIGEHKGAKVVQELAREILHRKYKARIVVIGTIDAPVDSAVVTVTGSYQQKELPVLLERYQVSVVLFPSIWPETFSYVVHELKALNAPVAVFDLGAQAESIREYAWGRVITDFSPSNLLNELAEFSNQVKVLRSKQMREVDLNE